MSDTETVPKDAMNENSPDNEDPEKNGSTPETLEKNGDTPETAEKNGETPKSAEKNGETPETAEKNGEKPETAAKNGKLSEQSENEKPTETASDEISHLEREIIRQLEYYFGDANLPRDKFLKEQVKLDDGWVPFDVMITFNRLAKLSKDLDAIADAVNKSTSGLLEVSEDRKKVRRNPEIPLPEMNEERRKEVMSRTIYVKGFSKDSSLDDLLKYFKQHGDVDNIVMRRYVEKATKKRVFKGSVFVTFKNKEQAQKFIDTKGIKFEDTELEVHWQDEYLQLKHEEYAARHDNKEKKHKVQEAKDQTEKEQIKLPQGTVLHFTESESNMRREDVKEALSALGGEVAYIDFKVGDKEGWVRLTKENAAKEILEKVTDGKLKVGESEITIKGLDVDEEKAYLEKTVEEMTKRRKNANKNKQHKGGFKGNRHQGGRKRKQGSHNDAPSAKVKA